MAPRNADVSSDGGTILLSGGVIAEHCEGGKRETSELKASWDYEKVKAPLFRPCFPDVAWVAPSRLKRVSVSSDIRKCRILEPARLGPWAMTLRKDQQNIGDLGPYVLAAAALHALLLALGLSTTFRHPELQAEILPTIGTLVSVDFEPPALARSQALPGGGGPIVRGSKDSKDEPARPTARVASQSRAAALDPVHPVDESDLSPGPSPDVEAIQASIERRRRGVEMAEAAAAFGTGRGANGGPGGHGAGQGAPPIHGRIAFGNGSRGTLTGRVCFLPVGTLRIADVHDCQYVATLYTDTLDIPERHFFDGFPGVTNRSEWFLIDYTGTFTVSAYGSYDFRLHSDDGSYLYIDDKLVIENDGKHAPASRSGSIALFAGQHRIKVRYAQTNDRMALQLFVRVPDAQAERIFTCAL